MGYILGKSCQLLSLATPHTSAKAEHLLEAAPKYDKMRWDTKQDSFWETQDFADAWLWPRHSLEGCRVHSCPIVEVPPARLLPLFHLESDLHQEWY